MSPTQIRFDDLDALRARVGEDFCALGPEVQVSQEMIDQFAKLTGDDQWIHTDVARAKAESPFGGTIAHGFLVLSLLPVLRVREDLAIVGYGNATNYGADRLRFLTPVKAGSRLRARARITAVDGKPKGTTVTEEIQVAIVGSETPALIYTMLVLYQPKR